MSETEVIKRAMTRAHPPVIMTLEDVADFLGHSYSHVRNDVQNQPGFPPKLERFKTPRFSRDAVMAWAGVQSN